MTGAGPGAEWPDAGSWRLALGVATVAVVFWVGYAMVSPTNFGGVDEWLLIDLASRGVLDFPYANRPLVLLWTAIAAHAWPDDLRAFWLFNGLYLSGAGCVTLLLARRLFPGVPAIPFLAGVFAAVWAPLDSLRLSGVLSCGYAGFTLCTMAALTLLVESWRRRRRALLWLGATLGFVAARGVESVIPVLLVAPLLLPGEALAPRGRAFRWLLPWLVMVVLALGLAMRPLVAGTPSYQGGALGLDPAPIRVAGRLLQLLGMQVTPVFTTPGGELANLAVPVAVAAFALCGFLVLVWRRPGTEPGMTRGPAARAVALGLVLAVAAHGGMALSRTVSTPARTQILSAPGFGLALAGAVVLVVSVLPGRRSLLGGLVLGCWIVAVGTARTVAQQGEWNDFRSLYAEQHRTLTGLVEEAPGFRPGTLVLLLGGARVWPMGFTFRHALSYLYPGQALGLVPNAPDMLYPWSAVPEGIVITPWASIQAAWGVGPSFHPWSSMVVVRVSDTGALELLEDWPPAQLPDLPEGAVYAPLERVERGGARPPSRRILRARPPEH